MKKYGTASTVGFMVKNGWKLWKSIIVFTILLGLLEMLGACVQMYVAPVILDEVQNGVTAGRLMLTILMFAGLLLVTNGGKAYVNTNTIFGRIDLRSHLIEMISDKMADMSMPMTEDPKVLEKLEAAQSVTGDNTTASEAIWKHLSEMIRDGLGLVLYIILLRRMPILLLITVVTTAILSFIFTAHMQNWARTHKQDKEKLEKQVWYVAKHSGDTVMGKDIRIFGMKAWMQDIFDSTLRAYLAYQQKVFNHEMAASLIDVFLTITRNAVAYIYLIRMVLNGGITAPQFLLYFAAFSGLTTWIVGLLQDVNALRRDSIDLLPVREFLDMEEPFRFEGGEPIPVPADGRYTLTLEHVRFRHPGADHDTIPMMDLTIEAGQKVAIVGLNGAGKTTLVKLLCGFYDPTEGRVLLNGKDIRSFNRRDYYALFTAVFQQFSFLPCSLAEDIAMGAEMDEERIVQCLQMADMWEKVQSLPKGIHTAYSKVVFDDGVEFSGGETQRLVLARALYHDAPILVLDEPTAALDPIAEDRIYRKYNELASGRTSVFISHRLASTRFCDRILMLEKGRVVEDGTHDELMQKQGAYAEMFEIQSQYYKEEGETNDN